MGLPGLGTVILTGMSVSDRHFLLLYVAEVGNDLRKITSENLIHSANTINVQPPKCAFVYLMHLPEKSNISVLVPNRNRSLSNATKSSNNKGIYLAESEQRSCALAAGTAFNGILCTAAGGYLVERLPDCTPETMSKMESNLVTLVRMDGGDALPTNLLLEGKTPVDIAEILLDGLGFTPLNSLEPTVWCECSEEKLFRSLRLLPREEVDTILREEGKIEARCQFCGAVYRMGPQDVEKRFSEATGDPSLDADFEG